MADEEQALGMQSLQGRSSTTPGGK